METTQKEYPERTLKQEISYNIAYAFWIGIVPLLTLFIIQFIYSFVHDSQPLFSVGSFVVAFILDFAFMSALLPHRPVSINRLTIPVYIRFAWQFGVWALCFIADTVRHKDYDGGLFIITGNCLEIFSAEYFYEMNHTDILPVYIITELLVIAAFVIVVLRRRKKYGTDGKKLSLKTLAMVLLPVSLLVSSAFVVHGIAYRNVITDLTHEEKNEYLGGHGFQYEGGWSSIDLKPYYVENEENILAELNEPAEFVITNPEDMPVLDGAEAAYPVYSAFANACYKNIEETQATAKEDEGKPRPIHFTNTVNAFEELIAGEVDVFFGARPSEAQKKLAEDAGKELALTPIGKEAFVFFVSRENPVDSLTAQQIKDIYSGKITNWVSVGGGVEKILAFQRPENSGSQTMMQYFMGDTPLKEPLRVEFEMSMIGVINEVANYRNGSASIGYSFRYYSSISGSEDIKLLAVDGVYPEEASISDGSYPLTTELYAVTLKDNGNENIKPFLEWMTGKQGQKLVADTGYVAVN